MFDLLGPLTISAHAFGENVWLRGSLDDSRLRFERSGKGRVAFMGGSITEIATPALVYGGHYGARVNGGAVVSKPGASVRQVAECPGARSIAGPVTPAGRSHGSCTAASLRRPAAKRRRPHPKRPGRPAPAPAFTG